MSRCGAWHGAYVAIFKPAKLGEGSRRPKPKPAIATAAALFEANRLAIVPSGCEARADASIRADRRGRQYNSRSSRTAWNCLLRRKAYSNRDIPSGSGRSLALSGSKASAYPSGRASPIVSSMLATGHNCAVGFARCFTPPSCSYLVDWRHPTAAACQQRRRHSLALAKVNRL